ncbi:TolC family protein [Niabella sp. CC-SYL272]|uniref:TolC family protein n=1 Tax=Niabella agricola TaxID=2891571 RepID=UPI001F38B173|nr:TolC family protein [Niabella agricola]MCF3107892.1 TolC family protein [Niabella agricola]
MNRILYPFILYLGLLCTGAIPAAAQRITIEEALHTAGANLEYEVNKAELKKANALTKTAKGLTNTGIFAENEDLQPGNAKGVLKIGVSQGLEWPGVYKARQQYFKEQARYYEMNTAAITVQLKKDVRKAYYQLWYLENRHQLYRRLDSMYSGLLQAATLRYQKGEAAGIEKIAAEQRLKELQAQEKEVQHEMRIQQQQLMLLLNTEQLLLPVDAPLQKLLPAAGENGQLHPLLALEQQTVNIAASNIRVQKNAVKPELSGRFFSQALYGMKNPYSGFSVSLGIPIFGAGANRQKIVAAQAEMEARQKNLEWQAQKMEHQQQQALAETAQADALLQYYENSGLNQSEEIIQAATIGYKGGEISFMELTQYLNQATDMQKNYLDALNRYNQAVIQYLYFTHQ